jgi:hypothetical protein
MVTLRNIKQGEHLYIGVLYVSKYIKADFKVSLSIEHFKAQLCEDHVVAQVSLMDSP